MKQTISRLTRPLLGVALVVTFGYVGAGGSAATRADAVRPAEGSAAACPGAHSAARVVRGRDHGQDPNSVTPAEARAADAALQTKVGALVRRGVLRPNGTLARARFFTVRTHVHVITASDGTGGVTARQIREQMKVLNASYGGRTAPQDATTPFRFKLVSTDTTANDAWYNWGLNDDDTETADAIAAKTALHEGGWSDLNIYIANLGSGLLGYATFPQDGVLPLDGLVVLNASLPGGSEAPYNEGDTATHEIGHWLGLYHTFENGCAFPGDYVADTPYQYDGDNIFYCDEADDTCPQPGLDPVHNFMSYGDDPCLDRFTFGQDIRMIGTWLAYRAGR
jgi:hypothetical protein